MTPPRRRHAPPPSPKRPLRSPLNCCLNGRPLLTRRVLDTTRFDASLSAPPSSSFAPEKHVGDRTNRRWPVRTTQRRKKSATYFPRSKPYAEKTLPGEGCRPPPKGAVARPVWDEPPGELHGRPTGPWLRTARPQPRSLASDIDDWLSCRPPPDDAGGAMARPRSRSGPEWRFPRRPGKTVCPIALLLDEASGNRDSLFCSITR